MKRLIIILLASCGAVYAQQNALLLPWTPQQFTNTNGTVLANGKVCTYLAGTSTGVATYTDATAATPNNIPPNAILLDSTGRPTSGGIWLKPTQAYKIIVLTAGSDNTCGTGVTIKTQDNVGVAGSTSGNNTFTGTNIFTGLVQCKNFENVRCVDAANAVGWAGTTGDAWINAAIADIVANSPTKGGEVWVAPGVYSVANTIRISTSDMKLKCLGISGSFNTGGPSCTLNWTGAAAGTMILVDTVNTSALTGDGIYGFFLNGQGANAAATGLSILSSQQGEYEQINLSGGFTAQSILLSVDPAVTNPASGSGSAQNWFRNVNVIGGAANAHGWNLTGTASQDVFMNTFHIVTANATGTGDAWHIENADNNRFISINGSSATGFGLHLTCMASAASQNMCARENEFWNSNLGSNPIKQDGVSTFYATSNRIYGYEICNGSALPTTSVILKGSLYVDSLDCGDNNFSTLIFAIGASGTSFQADNYNYKTGHTISNTVNYTSHIFDSSVGSVNKSLQWNDNGTFEWSCGLVGASEQWKCFDAVNGIDRLVLGKSGGSNANIYNVPTGLTHTFQVNNSTAFFINNTNILAGVAGAIDVGSASFPFGNLWLGTAATNNFKFQPAATTAARVIAIPDPGVNTNLALNLTGTSAAFATATTAGTCVQNTTAITGAATTMAVAVSPVSTPGVGAVWSAFVSSAGNVTINECAVATSAGGSIAFNIRVTP